jgi:hypothetical protein
VELSYETFSSVWLMPAADWQNLLPMALEGACTTSRTRSHWHAVENSLREKLLHFHTGVPRDANLLSAVDHGLLGIV